MGIWEEAKSQFMNNSNKENLWESVGAKENDPIAVDFSNEQKDLITEFIKSVPESCWINEEYKGQTVVKYQAPDKTIRFHRDSCRTHCIPYGEQKFIKMYFGYPVEAYVFLFKDGYMFAPSGGLANKQCAEHLNKSLLVAWATNLIVMNKKEGHR